jgi:hypothetical protein
MGYSRRSTASPVDPPQTGRPDSSNKYHPSEPPPILPLLHPLRPDRYAADRAHHPLRGRHYPLPQRLPAFSRGALPFLPPELAAFPDLQHLAFPLFRITHLIN